MKKFLTFTSIFMVLGFICLNAQSRTGVLTGAVVDNAQNEPLPGVRVAISSPSLIAGKIETISNERGVFRFVNIPPGLYEIRAEIDGFKSYIQTGIKVNLGLTKTVNIALEFGTLNEEVTVIGENPVVDVETNVISKNVTSEILAKLPSKRDMNAMMSLAPGVIVETAISGEGFPERSAGGAGSRQNSYSLDGTYMVDPATGWQMANFNYDIVEEIQVQTAGFSADTDNVMGAVINTITKSGGNNFSGGANLYYRSKSMRSENWEGTGLSSPSNAIKNQIEGSLNLGGPIFKNKLWFFVSGAYNPTVSETSGFQEDIKRNLGYLFGKLSLQLGKHRFSLMGNFEDDEQNHLYASAFRTPQSTLEVDRWTKTINGQWSWMLSSDALVEVHGAFVDRMAAYISNGPGPSYTELTTGVLSKSAGFVNNSWAKILQFQTSLSYWLEGFLSGDHDIKIGLDFRHGYGGYDSWQQPDELGFSSYSTFNGVVVQATKPEPTGYESQQDFRTVDFYIQDTYKIGRFNLNVGGRLNTAKAWIPEQRNVPERLNVASFTNFAPRIGFSYDFSSSKSNHQMAIKGYYGRYYSNLLAFSGCNPNSTTYNYYAPSNGQYIYLFSFRFGANPTSSDLKRPYVDSFIIGFDAEISKDISFRVNGIYRKSKDFICQIDRNVTEEWYEPISVNNPISGSSLTVYNRELNAPPSSIEYSNSSDADRDYKAIEIGVERRFIGNYYFSLYYTWSRSTGTVPAGMWNSGAMHATYGVWNNPNIFINSGGVLDLDRTHMIKFSGIYAAPWGVVIGLNYFGQSGIPYARQFNVALNQGVVGIRGEKVGSQRTPFLHNIDLKIEKSFEIGNTSPKVFFEIFNLLNSNTEIQVGSLYGSPSYERITLIVPPRIIRLGVRFDF